MRSLFSIHAGEFLVGSHIEREFRNLRVWLPSKDTGIDLLVTDSSCRRSLSLQVKFSRDFLATHMKSVYQPKLRACGWWKFKRMSLVHSPADYWILVLIGFQLRSVDCVIIRPKELLARLDEIHGRVPFFQSYLWVTANKRCFETRGLREPECLAIAAGSFRSRARNFSRFLNNWRPLRTLASRAP